jgi:hypothetical protein
MDFFDKLVQQRRDGVRMGKRSEAEAKEEVGTKSEKRREVEKWDHEAVGFSKT